MPTTPNTTNAAREAGQTVIGKCPHCGNVEEFHGMDMRPQLFLDCKPFCGNCAEFYSLSENSTPSAAPAMMAEEEAYPRLTLPPKTVFSDPRIRTV